MDDRKRQVETMKKRYGPNVYQEIGKRRGKHVLLAKRGSWKRWHPDRFNVDGTIKAEWEEEFNATGNKK